MLAVLGSLLDLSNSIHVQEICAVVPAARLQWGSQARRLTEKEKCNCEPS